MRKRWLIAALLLLTIVNLSAFSSLAWRRWHGRGPQQPCCATAEGNKILQQRLQLTAEQAAAVDTLRRAFAGQARLCASAMEGERVMLTQELLKTQPDTAAIAAILGRISSHHAELQRQSVDHLLAQKSLLTAEQQRQLFGLVLHTCAMNPSECTMNKNQH